MKPNVLITQGMRPFAHRVAKKLSTACIPLFGSAEEIPYVLINGGNFTTIPPANAPAFIHEVLKICLDREISAVIPLGAQELYPMAEARQLFSEYGVDIWVPPVTVLAGLPIFENPPKELPLTILSGGRVIAGGNVGQQVESLSGVFTSSDSGEEWALCCIAD